MVPMLTCGLVRSNFAFATGVLLWTSWFVRPARRVTPRTSVDSPGELFARSLRDDLLRHVRGYLGVGVELHAVARPALGLRPQVADVAEHLRQRHQGTDDAGTAALLHRLDDATAGVEVADDVAHVLLRRRHLDGHHRLEQRRVGLAGRLLEHHRTGD